MANEFPMSGVSAQWAPEASHEVVLGRIMATRRGGMPRVGASKVLVRERKRGMLVETAGAVLGMSPSEIPEY